MLFIALAGLLLASSCVKEDVPYQNKEQKSIIGFDSPTVVSGVSTKANVYGEITGTYSYGTTAQYKYPREQNFKIYAVEHVGDFTAWSAATPTEFDETSLSHDPSIDGWAPTYIDAAGVEHYYYWDKTKKMSFAALSPADLENGGISASYGDDGHTIGNYVMPEDLTKHYDLMYSNRIVNQTSANMIEDASQYYGIPLEFNHALSSIHFSLKNETIAKVILTKITLLNIKSRGTFKENLGSADPAGWSDVSVPVNVTPFEGTAEFPVTARYVTDIIKTEVPIDPNDKSNYVLAIPQELGTGVGCVQLHVEYTVNGSASSTTVNLSDYYTSPVSGTGVQIKEWEKGNRYTYRLVYTEGSALKDIIAFAPTTVDWNPIDVIVIPL